MLCTLENLLFSVAKASFLLSLRSHPHDTPLPLLVGRRSTRTHTYTHIPHPNAHAISAILSYPIRIQFGIYSGGGQRGVRGDESVKSEKRNKPGRKQWDDKDRGVGEEN